MKRGNMRINLLNCSLAMILAIVTYSGCSIVPKSFKETTLDDMYPILTVEQYLTLKSLNSDEEVNKFLEQYWLETESTSGTEKTEYLERLEYVKQRYPDRRGWGRSDRKRIYLIYGPPSYVEREESANIQLGEFSTIKSLEIWSYMTPETNNSLPSRVDNIYIGEMKFIFGDETGSGNFRLLYSSEDNGDIDIRMLNHK